MQKSNLSRALIFIRPSLLSGTLSFMAVFYIVLVTLWSTASDLAFVRQTVGSIFDRSNEVESASGTVEVFTDIFTSGLVSEMFYIIAWAFVGVLVYSAYLVLVKGVGPIKEIVNIHSQVERHRKDILHEVTTRIAFRFFMALIIISYIVVLLQVFIPVAVSNIELASTFNSVGSVAALLGALVLLFTGFHLVAILLRLFAMRVRTFGGDGYII